MTSPTDATVGYLTAADPGTGAEQTVELPYVLVDGRVYVSGGQANLDWLASVQHDREVLVRIGDPDAAPRRGVLRVLDETDASVSKAMVDKYGPRVLPNSPTLVLELGEPGDL